MEKQNPTAEIFSQGEELVTGQIVDSNAAWLSQQLVAMGLDVCRHNSVGDRLDGLVTLLREIEARADCCICSGGLGPTEDDLTAAAVALAFDRPLVEDPEALRAIEVYFRHRDRPMPAVNRKQALLPQGATRLDNHWGTAPGFALRAGRCRFYFVPGVPYEMRRLFETHIQPDLARCFTLAPGRLITLRCIGLGESMIQERLAGIEVPAAVRVSYRAALPENQLKLLFPAGFPEAAIDDLTARFRAAIGHAVFSVDGWHEAGGGLAEVLERALAARDRTLALAESVSGGEMATRCGDRAWLLESRVVGDSRRLCARFGLAENWPLAPEQRQDLARQLARAVRRDGGADYGLAQLCFETSAAVADENRRVTVYTGLADAGGDRCQKLELSGNSQRKRITAATLGLDMLRRYLAGHGAGAD